MVLGYNVLRLKSCDGFTLSPFEYINYKIKLNNKNNIHKTMFNILLFLFTFNISIYLK